MGYVDQRDQVLVHAKAAALAADPKWTDVAVGLPVFKGHSRGVRLFYGGEQEPEHLGTSQTIDGSVQVAQRVQVTAFWNISSLNDATAKAIEDQAATFVHELRSRLVSHYALSGKADSLRLEWALPDFVVEAGARFLVIDTVAIVDYTEYSGAAGA